MTQDYCHKSFLNAVQRQYAEMLLRWQWQWFCTLTFRDPPHPEQAHKTFRYWINQINQGLYGRRFYRKNLSIYWVLALEFHKSGVIHFHALLGDDSDLNTRQMKPPVRYREAGYPDLVPSRKMAHTLWYDVAGINRIDRIDDQLYAVSNYISKYVVKGGDLCFSDNIASFTSQLSGWKDRPAT